MGGDNNYPIKDQPYDVSDQTSQTFKNHPTGSFF